jgi:DNA polymerase III delta subunit
MIKWLIGENTFAIREAVQALERAFSGQAERIDATELNLADIPNIFMGASLFADKRLIIVSDLSKNTVLFEKISDWLPRLSDTIHLVCIDAKPDKRTASYKALKAVADVQEFPVWSDRDSDRAAQWVLDQAAQHGIALDTSLARHLVTRVGVDQWQLASALDIVALLDAITVETINAVIPAHSEERIFQLFEMALEGKRAALVDELRTLTLQQDPYALFALLTSQALSLAAVTFADDDDEPSKTFGIHPFVASKMTRFARRLGKARVAHILDVFAQTDADLKRSKADPWLLIERTLLSIAH